MAKITVSNSAFSHTEDVDEKGRVNAVPINDAMEECVRLAVFSLTRVPLDGYSEFQTRQIATLLQSMRWTHRAIRRILGFEGEHRAMAVDGLSLARIPLESLFSICLMLEGPQWVDRYLHDGWKKQYVRFLLQREETKALPRFAEYSDRSGPRNLDMLRGLLGVTPEQVATIYADEIGAPMPDGMKRTAIEQFPTPAGVLGQLPEGDKSNMLRRFYQEYRWLCSFVHGLSDAMIYKVLVDPESNLPFEPQFDVNDGFHRQVREPAYLLSLLSIIQAAAEIAAFYPKNLRLAKELKRAWKEVSTDALLGRAIWALRTKQLLNVKE